MKVQYRKNLFALALLAGLAAAVGCNGIGAQGPESGEQQLPFAEGKQVVVPANTMIYVRLQQPIMSATAQAGQSFAAVLDEPLLVDNQTVAPQGAEVTGKVVAARESGRLHAAGYVRITLSSITVKGKTIAVQTNSAIAGGGRFKNHTLSFLRGGSGVPQASSFQASESPTSAQKEAGFAGNSRIGFRLTQPLTIS